MTVLCLIELDGGAPADASLRALTLARSLGGTAVGTVVFADAADVPAAALAAYGVTDVYVTEPGTLEGYAPQAWARVLAGLAEETGASAVLAAGTDRGNEVLAHVGAITGLPMAANCTLVTPDGGRTHRLVRHRWAGLLLEDAVMEAPVALFTVATEAVAPVPVTASGVSAETPGVAAETPGVSEPAAEVSEPAAEVSEPAAEVSEPAAEVSAATPVAVQLHVHKAELADGDLVVRAAESAIRSGGVSLATARVVVGGGRGVGGPDGFAPLEELAELLGGVVGVSRVVTSEGWRPHRQQVGQTGTKITPELYLACGISGAIQHIAGCGGAKHIIAINTDPGAPILAHADYAIIGDLHQVIPALVDALRSRRRSVPDLSWVLVSLMEAVARPSRPVLVSLISLHRRRAIAMSPSATPNPAVTRPAEFARSIVASRRFLGNGVHTTIRIANIFQDLLLPAITRRYRMRQTRRKLPTGRMGFWLGPAWPWPARGPG